MEKILKLDEANRLKLVIGRFSANHEKYHNKLKVMIYQEVKRGNTWQGCNSMFFALDELDKIRAIVAKSDLLLKPLPSPSAQSGF